jgi:predicted anti-sigma-YlaC factor YlaD
VLSDYEDVGCEEYREALSARLDGEDDPDERTAVDAHLSGCAQCRAWLDAAAMVTRLARTGPVTVGPDLTEVALLAAPGPGRARLAAALRVALGLLGALQLFLGLVQVATQESLGWHGHDGSPLSGATPNHLWHESAAWNVAVGAGFLWVALRRVRPAGIVPILTAFVAVLTMLSADDVTAGRVEGIRLASHGFVFAGYLIVLALTRPSFSLGEPPSTGESPNHRGRSASRWRIKVDANQDVRPPATAARPATDLRGRPSGHAERRDAA